MSGVVAVIKRRILLKHPLKYSCKINCILSLRVKRSNLKVLRLLSPSGRRGANAVAGNDTNNEGTPTYYQLPITYYQLPMPYALQPHTLFVIKP